MDSGGYSHLIVAGSPKTMSQIPKLLPKKLSTQLVDIIPAADKVKTKSLVEKTLASFIQHEQEERLKAELFGDGLAVVGEDESICALENGQADMLLLADEYEDQEKKDKMVKL